MRSLCFYLIISSCSLGRVSGFEQSSCEIRVRNDALLSRLSGRQHLSSTTATLKASLLPSWLESVLNGGNGVSKKKSSGDVEEDESETRATSATVTRLAARKYQENGASKPSSREYTTRKDSCSSIKANAHGVENDYNHYRTVALKSTSNRAISILTIDVMTALSRALTFSSACDGDLGENILINGMAFDEIQINQQYVVGSVVLQVTEPMIPCANLCKLSYINDESLQPKERIARCQALLQFLDQPGDGFRGWYAKVIRPGEVTVGDEFRVLRSAQSESECGP